MTISPRAGLILTVILCALAAAIMAWDISRDVQEFMDGVWLYFSMRT